MICRIYDVTGGTAEQYDQVSEQMGDSRPEGAHVHIAGITGEGIKVIEVWDSQEHIDRYMESGLGQEMEKAELPEPKITQFEVRSFDWAQ
jgi:hypothetical protein